MKAFFVMVLVLVGGAVHSHGRTESEGTVFNKTQPRESMNNVTVSGSKFATFDSMYLVMQWPRSYCNFLALGDLECYRQQLPGRFTVHGLWPQSPRGRIDCRNRRKYGGSRRFDRRLLPLALVSKLNSYWLDLKSSEDDNNYCFWEYEYNKHGSCTFHDEKLYFDRTVSLVEQHRISPIHGGQIIAPGEHLPNDIRDVVFRATKAYPRLQCITVGNSIQLLEIVFCVNRKGNLLRNCDGVFGCGNGMVLIPLP